MNNKKLLDLLHILKMKPEDVSDSMINDNEDVIISTNFNNRLRLQKVVYIIANKTHDFDYPFSMYLRGPYSKELPKDYYNLIEEDIAESQETMSDDGKKLAEKLEVKEVLWLEIASTYLMFLTSKSKDYATKRTKEFKEDVLKANSKDSNYVDNVINEMSRLGIISN